MLLYRARDRWRWVRLTMGEWTHLERSQLAYERFLELTKGVRGPSVDLGRYGDEPGQYPPELNATSRLWYERDGRFRQERDEGGHRMTLVNDGDRVWIDTAQSGVIQHESQTIKPTGAELLDPAPLIPAFELRRAAETTVAGRGAFVVEASPRVAHAPPVDLVPHGSDEITLAVDAERGVVLRLEARFGGAPVRLLEVTEIAFDEVLPEETFRFAPPPGEEVRTAAEAYPTRNVTLEQAAREASFRVWSPSRLPGRWRAHVLHRPEMRRPRVPESVTILFTDDESLHHFGLEQAGEPVLAWRTGEEKLIDRNGLELRVIGGNVLPGPPLEVHVARDRTHIRVYSDNLDEDALIQIAASLTPAPTEQPPVSE